MAELEQVSRGIFALPNEILLSIFNLFPTRSLVSFTPTCQHFHSLIVRVLHHRLQIAAGLNGYTLYLECHAPSARLTAPKLFCMPLGTDGLQELLTDVESDTRYVGKVKRLGELYTRFRPQRNEPVFKIAWPHPAGDIPGSRTYAGSSAILDNRAAQGEEVVSETVTVDAHDLFSQLTTQVFLAEQGPRSGILFHIQEVCDGLIRVWRKWLAEQCEGKKWTDGEAVIVHHETPSSPVLGKGKARADSATISLDPTRDPSILWVNTRDDNVGIKFRVKERKWRPTANPILYTSDVEVAVSYEVQFEEILVRTTHLLLTLEEAQKQMDNHSGKAIVFGSYAGIQEFDTAGHPRR